MTSLGIRRAVRLIVPQLRQAILASKTEENGWSGMTGALLWILSIGSVASVGTHDEQWFVLRLARVADSLDLRTDAQLREFLRSYFYLGSVQSKSLEVLSSKLRSYDSFSTSNHLTPVQS